MKYAGNYRLADDPKRTLTSVERDRQREANRQRMTATLHRGGYIEAIVEVLRERPSLTLPGLMAEIDRGGFAATNLDKCVLRNLADYSLRVARVCLQHEAAKKGGAK